MVSSAICTVQGFRVRIMISLSITQMRWGKVQQSISMRLRFRCHNAAMLMFRIDLSIDPDSPCASRMRNTSGGFCSFGRTQPEASVFGPHMRSAVIQSPSTLTRSHCSMLRRAAPSGSWPPIRSQDLSLQ